jgi:adenosine deaminase CECR1
MENSDLEADDAWHQKEGVPRLEDEFIQKFLSGRDALVAQEKKQRSGP